MTEPKASLLAVVLLICLHAAAARAEDDFVPFAIPARPHPDSRIAFAFQPIPREADRIVVRNGHFHRGGKRIRIWGVNLCFGACFPAHEDARHVAARLAAAGVNSVRFHHMDMGSFPRGIWQPKQPTTLSDEALDRLDFFLDQLALRGIYANLNLHVSRTHSRVIGLPEPGTSYDKMVGIFTPKLIEAQKQYARELLTHVNKYRKLRYADDPAVAFVEITNEDSLFMWGASARLAALPEYYAKTLQARYAAWLKKRYGSTGKLRKAWGAGASPLGENVLADTRFDVPAPKDEKAKRWNLEQHGECAAKLKPVEGRNAIRLEVVKADATDWHLQFNQTRQQLRQGQYYTLAFAARADKPRRLYVNVGMAHEPWKYLGFSRAIRLTGTWRRFRFGFAATADDDNARVNFSFGGSRISVELADIELRKGGRVGLAEGESLGAGSVVLYGDSETEARRLERMRFLAETEKGYFDDMYAFIRKDLGCKALITGTIVFGPLGLYGQSDMDFLDGHAYWHHPRFPGRPWDSANWTVEQQAMTDHPDRSTVVRLSAQRLLGKPYTVSEYNHPAPNDYQAECVPLLATWAAAQDWDGIWLFTYSHSAEKWDRQHYSSFFDICGNPAKWGFMPAGTALFREDLVVPGPQAEVVALVQSDDPLADLARLHLAHDRDLFAAAAARARIQWSDLLTRRLYVTIRKDLARDVVEAATKARPGFGHMVWTVTKGRGTFAYVGEGALVRIGHPTPQRAPDLRIARPEFSALVLVNLEPQRGSSSRRFLAVACGRCENVDMGFSKDRRTVGRAWGKPPARIQAVTATVLSVPFAAGEWKCAALGPDGRAATEVRLSGEGKEQRLELAPKHKTMWYLLTREKAKADRKTD